MKVKLICGRIALAIGADILLFWVDCRVGQKIAAYSPEACSGFSTRPRVKHSVTSGELPNDLKQKSHPNYFEWL